MLQDTFVFGGSRHCLPLSDLPPAQPSHRAVRSSLSGSFFATSSHELSPGHVNSSRPPHAQHSPGHVSLRPQQHSLGHVFDLSHRVDAQAPEIGRNQGAAARPKPHTSCFRANGGRRRCRTWGSFPLSCGLFWHNVTILSS